MGHLNERITEYIFNELPSAEMVEARAHVAGCKDCRQEVEWFERTHSMLMTSQDVNPPRSVVFEFAKPAPVPARFWKWVAPMAAAAVLAMGVVLAAPIQIQWKDSQLTIAFGKAPAATTAAVPVVERVVEKVAAEPVDYARIQQLISDEVVRKDISRTKEIQRLRGELAYVEGLQQATERSVMGAEASIAMLVPRSPSED